MGMTIAEKILAHHAGLDHVTPGELVECAIDLVFGHDVTAPLAVREFERIGTDRVFDPTRVALFPDHFCPSKDIAAAEEAKKLREFGRKYGIRYFEVGQMGIEHAFLPEQGLVLPGDLVIGADSHSCTHGALGAFATGVGSTDMAAAMALGRIWLKVPESLKFVYRGAVSEWVGGKDLILYTIGKIGVDGAAYQVMEFDGDVIRHLSMDGRFTMCNMAVEAGAKTAIIAPDATTLDYVRARAGRPYTVYSSDPDAAYRQVYEFDVSALEPQVALPHLPSNVTAASRVGHISIDQVVIGSCTNGRIEDLRMAARVLRGRRVSNGVRAIIIPATQRVYLEALREGLLEVFVEAGAVVSTPTCGPCLGGHMGVLAEGERAVATTNRNFVGRMGHPRSEVYLAGPAVAAASAIAGRIADPREVVQS